MYNKSTTTRSQWSLCSSQVRTSMRCTGRDTASLPDCGVAHRTRPGTDPDPDPRPAESIFHRSVVGLAEVVTALIRGGRASALISDHLIQTRRLGVFLSTRRRLQSKTGCCCCCCCCANDALLRGLPAFNYYCFNRTHSGVTLSARFHLMFCSCFIQLYVFSFFVCSHLVFCAAF